jgi:hypothetical protein
MRKGSADLRAVQTIFHRYNEVSTTLAERPNDYCPIFMIDDDDNFVVTPWAAGFILGIGLRRREWTTSILLTPHRSLLVPILVYHELGGRLVPDVAAAEQQRRRTDAYHQIPEPVAAIRRICNPHRGAETEPRTSNVRVARRAKREAIASARISFRKSSSPHRRGAKIALTQQGGYFLTHYPAARVSTKQYARINCSVG